MQVEVNRVSKTLYVGGFRYEIHSESDGRFDCGLVSEMTPPQARNAEGLHKSDHAFHIEEGRLIYDGDVTQEKTGATPPTTAVRGVNPPHWNAPEVRVGNDNEGGVKGVNPPHWNAPEVRVENDNEGGVRGVNPPHWNPPDDVNVRTEKAVTPVAFNPPHWLPYGYGG